MHGDVDSMSRIYIFDGESIDGLHSSPKICLDVSREGLSKWEVLFDDEWENSGETKLKYSLTVGQDPG